MAGLFTPVADSPTPFTAIREIPFLSSNNGKLLCHRGIVSSRDSHVADGARFVAYGENPLFGSYCLNYRGLKQ